MYLFIGFYFELVLTSYEFFHLINELNKVFEIYLFKICMRVIFRFFFESII